MFDNFIRLHWDYFFDELIRLKFDYFSELL